MTRKENEKDPERPHYYSQFWLDVAAGRRIIGAPKTNDETDMLEPDADVELEPVILRNSGRNSDTAYSDGYQETISHPEVEPEFDDEEEELVEPEPDEIEMEDELEDVDIPNIVVEETEIPDMDLAVEDEGVPVAEVPEEVPLEEAEEEEEEFFEDEDEDDISWTAGRGRKKPKPGQAAKLPVKKPKKREPRRGGY